jgi:parallel beta helix pectate lyase-like protein
MRIGIALMIGFGVAASGCNDDNSSGSNHDPVVYHIGLLDYTFEEAADLALPGDTLVFESSPPQLTNTIVFGENQTPLVLTATKQHPRITAPDSLPALRFVSPKSGTRIEHLAFAGGNYTINVSGAGSLTMDDCKFLGAQIQVFGSGDNLTLNVTRSEFVRPSSFGIAVQSSTVLHADKISVIGAGDCGVLITGSATGRVANSILYNAANFGVACTAQGKLSNDSGCNDIYGSPFPVLGCAEPANDFHLDPLFCDPAHDIYTILSISPCAPANSGGCGQIGAYLPACDPPPPPP